MKNINLQLTLVKARQLHKTASPEIKTILEESVPKGFFSESVKDRIKTYEDACLELGQEQMNEQAYTDFRRDQLVKQGFSSDQIESKIASEIAREKLETIFAAYNEGRKIDTFNTKQRKYIPWFGVSSGGFVFLGTGYYCSLANAGGASRLCCVGEDDSETQARAADLGRKFIDLFEIMITK